MISIRQGRNNYTIGKIQKYHYEKKPFHLPACRQADIMIPVYHSTNLYRVASRCTVTTSSHKVGLTLQKKAFRRNIFKKYIVLLGF